MTASIIQRLWALSAVVLVSLATPVLAAEAHPGQAVYDRACAACHNAPEPGSRAAPVAKQHVRSAALHGLQPTSAADGSGPA